MLGTLKNRVLEGGKQLKSTLEEHSAEMNQRIQMNISINSEKLNAVAAAASNVVTTVAKSTTSSSHGSNPVLGSKDPDEVIGGPFFASFVHRQQQVLIGHNALIESGERLADVVSKTRQRVTAEAQSAMYLQHNFQNITNIREGIRSIRDSIQSLVVLMEEVEQLLMTKTEEHLVFENAAFAQMQQEELERYEHEALVEKQARMQQRHQERQKALGEAFEKDLKTYQSIVTYQGQIPILVDSREETIPLEAIEISIAPDTDLEVFYKEDEEELVQEVAALATEDAEEETKEEAVAEEVQEVAVPAADDDTISEIGPEIPSDVPTLRLESDDGDSD